MPVMITCVNPTTGQVTTFPAATVGDFGGGGGNINTQGLSLFGARDLPISMAKVQETIAAGRAAGFKPFNFFNSYSPWDSGQ